MQQQLEHGVNQYLDDTNNDNMSESPEDEGVAAAASAEDKPFDIQDLLGSLNASSEESDEDSE